LDNEDWTHRPVTFVVRFPSRNAIKFYKEKKIVKTKHSSNLKGMFTMTGTNRSNTLRSALGLFAMGFALLFPLQARAQVRGSLLNFSTGTALSNGGSPAAGVLLITSIWLPIDNWTQQQWQFVRDLNYTYIDPSDGSVSMTISSLNSFKYMDVIGHDSSPGVVQANRLLVDNTTPWQFQTWKINLFGFFGVNAVGYYTLQNRGSGMCLTDLGQPGVGGPVFQMPCNGMPNQLWAIWNWDRGLWETPAGLR
jgi:hypothetical protein